MFVVKLIAKMVRTFLETRQRGWGHLNPGLDSQRFQDCFACYTFQEKLDQILVSLFQVGSQINSGTTGSYSAGEIPERTTVIE
jgi:hypothetical protein